MARSTIIRATNITGSTIPAGSVVYISGYNDDKFQPTIALASNDDPNRMPAVGVVREDAANNDTDIVVKVSGAVAGFETSDLSPNTAAYVGQNGGIVFGDEPSSVDENLLTQQLGTVLTQEDTPNGQLQLFPLEVKRRIRHPELIEVEEDQHHIKIHAETHRPGEVDEFLHARQHAKGGGDEVPHDTLRGLEIDSHIQYSLADGTRPFTGTVGGIDPVDDADLATKYYVDNYSPWRLSVKDKDLLSPPGSPSVGDRYIVAGGGGVSLGLWTGQELNAAEYRSDGWLFRTPTLGYSAYVQDEHMIYSFNGVEWELVTASNITVSEHYIQHSLAFLDLRKNLDGYRQTINEHYIQHSDTFQTIRKELDGYDANIKSNRNYIVAHGDAFHTIRKDLDGYRDTINEHYDQHSAVFQTIRKDLDGYREDIASNKNYLLAHGQAFQTILKELDGYGSGSGDASDQTVSEHYQQHSAAIQTILKELDGYGSGAGDVIKVGTPVDNQIGVWTGDGTLEGDTNLTWNSVTLNIDGNLKVAGSIHNDDLSESLQVILQALDGYGSGSGDASDQTVSEHYAQHSVAIQTILKELDGYSADTGASDQTVSEHYRQHSDAIQAILQSLDGYASDFTTSEHYQQHSAAIQTILKSLDGYGAGSGDASDQTVSEHYAQHSEAIQTILQALDGYGSSGASDQTVSEHYQQHSEAIQIILQALDGYGIDTTLSEHYQQHSNAIQTILQSLDGYGAGSGDASDQTVSEHYQQHSDAIQTILKELDGYGTAGQDLDQTVWEHYQQHSAAIQTILKDLDGYALQSDLFGLDQTVIEHYHQHSGAIQTIISSLDGYSSDTGLNQTVSEHYQQHSGAIQTIVKDLDGYLAGSGQNSYVAVFDGLNSISGEHDLFFDQTDGYLAIGTTNTSERLTVNGAVTLAEVSEPAEEAGLGKLYVNIKNGRIFFKMEDGQNIDLTKFDIDGGSFTDTFEVTNNFDAGTF